MHYTVKLAQYYLVLKMKSQTYKPTYKHPIGRGLCDRSDNRSDNRNIGETKIANVYSAWGSIPLPPACRAGALPVSYTHVSDGDLQPKLGH